MSVFTPFISNAVLYAGQLNTALMNILGVAQRAQSTADTASTLAAAAQAQANAGATAASAAQSLAAAADALATSDAAAVMAAQAEATADASAAAAAQAAANAAQATANAAQATANTAVKTVLGVSPDGTGNVALTAAELPFSAGSGISISPAGVIAATGGGGGTPAPSTFNFLPIASGSATLSHNGDGTLTVTSPNSGQGQFGIALPSPGNPYTLEMIFSVSVADPNFVTYAWLLSEVAGAANMAVAFLVASGFSGTGTVYAGLGSASDPGHAYNSSASSLSGFTGSGSASVGSTLPGSIGLALVSDGNTTTWKNSTDGGLTWSVECVVPNSSLGAAGASAPNTVGFGLWNQSASSLTVSKFILTQP